LWEVIIANTSFDTKREIKPRISSNISRKTMNNTHSGTIVRKDNLSVYAGLWSFFTTTYTLLLVLFISDRYNIELLASTPEVRILFSFHCAVALFLLSSTVLFLIIVRYSPSNYSRPSEPQQQQQQEQRQASSGSMNALETVAVFRQRHPCVYLLLQQRVRIFNCLMLGGSVFILLVSVGCWFLLFSWQIRSSLLFGCTSLASTLPIIAICSHCGKCCCCSPSRYTAQISPEPSSSVSSFAALPTL
jgi:hypothetical protein